MKFNILIWSFALIAVLYSCSSAPMHTVYVAKNPRSVTLMNTQSNSSITQSVVIEEFNENKIKESTFSYSTDSQGYYGSNSFKRNHYPIDSVSSFSISPTTDYEKTLGRQLNLSTNFLRGIRYGKSIFYRNQQYVESAYKIGLPDIVYGSYHFSKPGNSISLGIGGQWSRFKLNSSYIPYLSRTNKLCFEAIPNEYNTNGFNINNFALELPITLSLSQPYLPDIFLSAVGIYNFQTACRGSYLDGSALHSFKFANLNSNSFGVELRGTIAIRGVLGVFIDWSPTKLFSNGNGPEFSYYTIGVSLTHR